MIKDEEMKYREHTKRKEQLSTVGLFSLENTQIRENATEIYKIISSLPS